jgi:hypothetical protein
MKYGKRILCENRGRFYMREILQSNGATLFVDDGLARIATPEQAVANGWALPAPINPQ